VRRNPRRQRAGRAADHAEGVVGMRGPHVSLSGAEQRCAEEPHVLDGRRLGR
jgi:hypothetical protein